MAAADVEGLCEWMWAHCYPTLPDVTAGLIDALEEGAIARVEGASAAQVAVMQEIRAAAEAEAVSAERIAELDAAVAAGGQGPFYYNMIVLMYDVWADEYRAFQSPAGSEGSGSEDSDSEDSEESPEIPGGVRRTGRAHVGGSSARMALLLQQMRGCV